MRDALKLFDEQFRSFPVEPLVWGYPDLDPGQVFRSGRWFGIWRSLLLACEEVFGDQDWLVWWLKGDRFGLDSWLASFAAFLPNDRLGSTLVLSARVSDLPQEPPSEPVQDADWVEIVAY